MKKIHQKSIITNLIILTIVILSISLSCYATNSLPFFYNVLPTVANGSIIDGVYQKTLKFNLFEKENKIFYNGKEIEIINNSFEIDISDLNGKVTLVFENDENEKVSLNYFISDENGFVKDYKLENRDTFVKTIDGIKIIFTDNDTKTILLIEEYIKTIPQYIKSNVSKIVLLPNSLGNKTAGVTKNTEITLYNLSKYSSKTIQNILFHEIAHTWARKLMDKKEIDFSYSKYSLSVKADKNYVSSYTKEFIKKNADYSEDFADSVAFYLMNKASFENKYPNRANYITELLNK